MPLNPCQLQEVLSASSYQLIWHEPIGEICFDTREIIPELNPLFVALPGKRNGEQFIPEAIRKGVRNILSTQQVSESVNFWQVESPLRSLQQLAAVYRKQLQVPILAITGTIGKTILKETLAREFASQGIKITKNIGSYNSQLGVPVSILNQLQPNCLHLQEVATTEIGEIKSIATILQPTYGIFTRSNLKIKDSFRSQTERIQEYLLLFRSCEIVWIPETETLALELAEDMNLSYRIVSIHGNWITDLCKAILQHWFPLESIKTFLPALVDLKREIHTDSTGLTVLHEPAFVDEESLRKAIFYLLNQFPDKKRQIILGKDNITNPEDWQRIHQWIEKFSSSTQFHWINPPDTIELPPYVIRYPSTDAFQQTFSNQETVVLVKGQGLEKIVPYLTKKVNATQFRIDLTAICKNYQLVKKRIGQKKIIAMLKASAYGSGSWQIARELQMEGVDAIAVANVVEAIELRERGIRLPILVLAADRFYPELLFQYQLEPAIWSIEWLTIVQKLCEEKQTTLSIHLEIDTGMSRLGLVEADIPKVMSILRSSPYLKPETIFTHLSSSEDDSQDAFTIQQLTCFTRILNQVRELYPQIQTHFANTGAILRFSDIPCDFVRLGIGLYGVSPVKSEAIFIEAGTLRTEIIQIHSYPSGTPVGYNQAEVLKQHSRIATIP
ncbi:MAG: alanine racemase, partial [Bacteroidia bacterium]|nr:alanine racemase [Bacteroidia bacterium]